MGKFSELAYRDGYLCVTMSDIAWDKPVLCISYFPVLKTNDPSSHPVGERVWEIQRYVYEWSPGAHNTRQYTLIDGNNTESIAQDEIPIKKPRGRHKWYQGEWHKDRGS